MMENKKYGLGSAKRPSHYGVGINNNESVFNNSLCHICGGDHNVLVISLESGGHITTRPFPKEKATRVKVGSGIKGRATKLDLVDVFWPSEGER
jgi:hypothetical protein